ncbi:hypothetical protein FOQG_18715 [Fusarium oxysporum f. sp. raphani 54005]|uniref:Uncharacterized protein n=3 Tax=Fusarium oxysporum TaxID=5507 RepID=X0BDH0_FUSOX|nr:hypothetical protein FOQG_18715 [Fusarium oxysporum f. sp. raphani 54005]EXM13803.1 hypothetical protein FOTG_17761 [Fusarium oxysporum f. sp. vasinfectum 25433]KAG7413156.1 hypothetical protein Forpi1262_v017260 [Fusarium oxysporum f. sp. raphani]KAK2670152.1 hypothetical protein RAB80_014289 [Fusarium oxysporum f. sp. vasinfectum]KAK2671569.1 hypothetical protein RAB80_011648 [Fusarium oxysporum f. sp. vasinfectum]
MSTTQPCHSPTSEPRPYPRHPAPWRQTEATLYERINDVTLPDVVESAGSYLVAAPPTPIPEPSSLRDAVFIKRLHRALEVAAFGQALRCRMYGLEIAGNTRPGHTPPGLKEKLRLQAWETDSSSESETSTTPTDRNTPLSYVEELSKPESPIKDSSLDGAELAPPRKRRSEDAEEEGDAIKRRRRASDH